MRLAPLGASHQVRFGERVVEECCFGARSAASVGPEQVSGLVDLDVGLVDALLWIAADNGHRGIGQEQGN